MSNYAGDWDKCYIELLRNVDCKSRQELERIEGDEIKSLMNSQDYTLINRNIAGRTKKEYYNDNLDKLKKNMLNYYKNNADKLKEYQRNYDKLNADKKREYQRNYYKLKNDLKNSHK